MSLIKTQLLEPILEANNYEFEGFDKWNRCSSISLTPEEQEIGRVEWGKEEIELPEWEFFGNAEKLN